MLTSLKFIIDYKPKVESGELVVFAMNPEPQKVEIIKWDRKDENYPIVAMVGDEQTVLLFSKEGKSDDKKCQLFVKPSKDELTEFEKELKDIVNSYNDGGQMNDVGAAFYARKLRAIAYHEILGEHPYSNVYKLGAEAGRKRMPCINGWLVRQNNGELDLFWRKPISEKLLKERLSQPDYEKIMKLFKHDPGCYHELPGQYFQEIKPDDNPVEVLIYLHKKTSDV